MMITDPNFREFWGDVNDVLAGMEEEAADWVEMCEHIDLARECAEAEDAACVAEAISWGRQRRAQIAWREAEDYADAMRGERP